MVYHLLNCAALWVDSAILVLRAVPVAGCKLRESHRCKSQHISLWVRPIDPLIVTVLLSTKFAVCPTERLCFTIISIAEAISFAHSAVCPLCLDGDWRWLIDSNCWSWHVRTSVKPISNLNERLAYLASVAACRLWSAAWQVLVSAGWHVTHVVWSDLVATDHGAVGFLLQWVRTDHTSRHRPHARKLECLQWQRCVSNFAGNMYPSARSWF